MAIDGEDVQGRSVNEITEIMTKKHNMERLLTVITSMHSETNNKSSVGTLWFALSPWMLLGFLSNTPYIWPTSAILQFLHIVAFLSRNTPSNP